MYLVHTNGLTHYLGDDRDQAIHAFESCPGSMLEKPESIEDLAGILKRDVSDACHDVGATPEEVEQMMVDAFKRLSERFSGFLQVVWDKLAERGVSREKVSEVWSRLQEEAASAAAEAELGGKQGLAGLGDLLVRVGNSMIEKSKYKNGTS